MALSKENKDAIVAYLKAKPNMKAVYFNEAGEWLFVKREGYDEEISREELLSETTESSAAEETKTVKSKKS